VRLTGRAPNGPPVIHVATSQRHGRNEAIVRRFVDDVWNGGNPDAIETLTTPAFVLHQLVADEHHDRESFSSFHAGLSEAVPDLTIDVEDLVVDGHDAVALVRMRGTPERPYQALRPTGESFDVHAFHKYRLADGRVDEVWVMADAVGTMRQLGLFPPSPGTLLRVAAGKARKRLLGG